MGNASSHDYSIQIWLLQKESTIYFFIRYKWSKSIKKGVESAVAVFTPPQNTLEAFAQAAAAGTGVVELQMVLSAFLEKRANPQSRLDGRKGGQGERALWTPPVGIFSGPNRLRIAESMIS